MLRRAALEPFENCKNVLKQLDQALSVQYQKTNKNIFNNSNPHFKVGAKNNFTIATPKQEDKAVDLLKPYFPDRHFVPLPEILSTMNITTSVDSFDKLNCFQGVDNEFTSTKRYISQTQSI